eukprot:5049217-Alexandrium_andersonii.AAC.1
MQSWYSLQWRERAPAFSSARGPLGWLQSRVPCVVRMRGCGFGGLGPRGAGARGVSAGWPAFERTLSH